MDAVYPRNLESFARCFPARAICTDVRTHGTGVFSRFKSGQDGALWYYRTLADAFRRLMPGALAEELSYVVATMEKLGAGADQIRYTVPVGVTP